MKEQKRSGTKPRYRINHDTGLLEPVIDWDAIEAMEVNDQIAQVKELLRTFGTFLLNSRRFAVWMGRYREEIVEWHRNQNTS